MMNNSMPGFFCEKEKNQFDAILSEVGAKIRDLQCRIDNEAENNAELSLDYMRKYDAIDYERLYSSSEYKRDEKEKFKNEIINNQSHHLTKACHAMTQLEDTLQSVYDSVKRNSNGVVSEEDRQKIVNKCDDVLPTLSEHRDNHWFKIFIRTICCCISQETESEKIVQRVRSNF